jgi:cell division protein ZapB
MRMTHELDALENKIAQVVSLCRVLRSENNSLRQRLVAAEAEKHGLAERVEMARGRIEQLARQLPEAKTLP